MSLWEIVAKNSLLDRGQKLEKGMKVNVQMDGMVNPFCTNEGKKKIAEALSREYGGVWDTFVEHATSLFDAIRKK